MYDAFHSCQYQNLPKLLNHVRFFYKINKQEKIKAGIRFT